MGLESEIRTLVKTLVQGKSKGSLKTLAGTDFETLARLGGGKKYGRTLWIPR